MQDEFNKILAAGQRLAWPFTNSARQLGSGAYLAQEFGIWKNPETSYNCAITVDADAWAAVNKAWVPEKWVNKGGQCVTIWYPLAANSEYIDRE